MLRPAVVLALLAPLLGVAWSSVGPAAATYDPVEPRRAWSRVAAGGPDEYPGAVDVAGGIVWSVATVDGPRSNGLSRADLTRSRLDTGRVLTRITLPRRLIGEAMDVDAGPWGAVAVGTAAAVRLRPDGSVLWSTRVDVPDLGVLTGIRVIAQTAYVVGYSYPDGGNAQQFLVVPLSLATGDLGVPRSFGGPGTDLLESVAVDRGRLVVGGTRTDEGSGDFDAVVMALDPADLSTIWSRRFGDGGDDVVTTLAAREGRIYFGSTSGISEDVGTLGDTGVVGALTSAGRPLWRDSLGRRTSVESVVAVPQGVVVGGTARAGVLDDGPVRSDRDAFLLSRSPGGVEGWTEVFGGRDDDVVVDLAAAGRRVVTAGYAARLVGDDLRSVGRVAAYDTPRSRRPDLSVRASDGRLVGDNRLGSAKPIRLVVAPAEDVELRVRLENDGYVADRFELDACGVVVTRSVRSGRAAVEVLRLRRTGTGPVSCVVALRSLLDATAPVDRLRVQLVAGR